jgi:excisionase family DNA binding protein
MENTPLLYKINEACAALAISRTAIYAMMKSGSLRYVQMGAERRIPAKEVLRIATEGVDHIKASV